MASIQCVVVNYNAGDHLSACVGDLLAQDMPGKVVVVDNGSTDTSLDGLRQSGTKDLEIIRNRINRGFGAACNQGAAGATSAYLAFINPDCRLDTAALGALARTLESAPQSAIAGAWVSNAIGAGQRGTQRMLPTPRRALMTFTGLDHWMHRWPGLAGVNLKGDKPDAAVEVEAVNGACFMIRRASFEQLHGFDEAYFLHCEDLDLFKRARDAGFRILLVPDANALHVGGVSSASAPFKSHWHKHVSMARYWRKHYAGHWGTWLGLAGLWLNFLVRSPAAIVHRYRSG